ncbi:MAG TPA: CehA/McbA family metallohydrolase, partial [Rudaea sp.]|nr:CehA/McbA family metallohydrolase [Rudaea sp.]
MYLPQLTTGPSALAFSPDGKELIYSMGGSLWRQAIGSSEARELTHAKGYDYQPDWSPDGRHVVFVRYQHDALELWQLELQSGKESALTGNKAVNVQPRYSPDGTRIAYVSTNGTGHFDLYVAQLDGDTLAAPRRIVGERKSAVPRYYYSAFDHAIDPSWTPDGKRLVFISNREIAYGSGAIWSVAVDAPDDLKPVYAEETTWRAQPQVAPDGRRILFSSYHGRQWHQLWLTTIDGAAPLPVTFGEFDRTDARFSADGTRIGYISNEGGNTSLWVQTMVGGALTRIDPAQRKYRNPRAPLRVSVRDENGAAVPARVSVVAADGRAYAPDNAWMHADDGFDRGLQPFENHYFHCAGECALDVPVGNAHVVVTRGMDYAAAQRDIQIKSNGATAQIALAPLHLPDQYGRFVSADLHVHMNYGGRYRQNSEGLMQQARAEHLDAVFNLVVNKEERVPDIAGFGTPPLQKDGVLLMQAQEYHSSYWGHLGLLFLDDHYLTPGYAAYRQSALTSPYPTNGAIADLTHAQHGLVGYAHPFDTPPETDAVLTNALPADVALGKADYYEAVGFDDHLVTNEIWYRLLNCGFRLPAGAGTDAMTNYASLRGPVGMNRVFLDTGGADTPQALRDALTHGRTFATNSALLGLEIEGRHPGDELTLSGPRTVTYHAALRSFAPIEHFELVYNGKVVATQKLTGAGTQADVTGTVALNGSGWLLLRAWNKEAQPLVLDIYPYATTGPVYVTIGGKPARSPADAAYFVRWLDRVIETSAARNDYN